MPNHEIHVSPKPAEANLLVQLLWQAFSFAYGTFSLFTFVLLALFRKNNFRRLDDKSRQELSVGTYGPILLLTVSV
jgi:hypothetical protein